MPDSLAVAVADASSGRVALVEAVLRPFWARLAVQYLLKLFVFAPTTPPKQPPLAPRRRVTPRRPGDGTSRACFFTSLRASPLRSEVLQPSGAIVVVGQKSVTQYVFPQPPRHCTELANERWRAHPRLVHESGNRHKRPAYTGQESGQKWTRKSFS